MRHALETYAARFNRDPRESILADRPDGVSAALWMQDLPGRAEFQNPPVADCHVLSFRLAPVECHMEASGRLIHEGRSKPGSFSLIRAGDRPRAILSGQWRTLTIFLPASVVEDVRADEETAQSPGRGGLDSDGFLEDATLTRCAREILSEMRDGLPLARAQIDCLGQEIAIRLLRLHDAGRPAGLYGTPADRRLKRAQDLIEDRLGHDLCVADLAEAAGVSAVHLTSLFRKATGLSPHKWVVQRRVERARGLLTGSDLSITEIAVQCGFATSQHFALAFRRHLGVTPTEYRRTIRF